MPYVTTADHTQLYYKDWGRGRPVVLLHGWPLSADSWDDQAFALADAGYRVIAYDRRGFGRSSQPWNGYDYDTLTDDLRAVLKECQVSEGTLIGFSMGGGEVARYMTKYNGAGLVQAGMIASIVPYKLKTPDNPTARKRNYSTRPSRASRKTGRNSSPSSSRSFTAWTGPRKPVSKELLQWSLNVTMQAGLKATLACAESFFKTDFRPDLASFKVPTLIIHGTADQNVSIDASARPAAQGIRIQSSSSTKARHMDCWRRTNNA
jgi:pimeloyl-ACP methyl ester carboxylesterase